MENPTYMINFGKTCNVMDNQLPEKVKHYTLEEVQKAIDLSWEKNSINKELIVILKVFHRNDIKDFNKLRECIKAYPNEYNEDVNVGKCLSIIDELPKLYNAHIENIRDFKHVIEDLSKIAEPIPLKDIDRILFLINSSKYYYKKEIRNVVYITDTDFIDIAILKDEQIQQSILYGILHSMGSDYEPYDVIANHYNNIQTPIFKTVRLKEWKSLIVNTLERLNKWKDDFKDASLIVKVPFIGYSHYLDDAIRRYTSALDTITILIDNNIRENIPLENPDMFTEMPSLRELMMDYELELEEEGYLDDAWAVHQERIQRGFIRNEVIKDKNAYRTILIGKDDVKTNIKQSEITENQQIIEKEDPAIRRASVLYYMLKDKVDINLMHKVIHFATNAKKEYKGSNANDTIYTYLQHPEDRFLDKVDKIDYIKENLKKYKFSEEEIDKLLNIDE